jgi:hypothetical protein
MMRSMDDDDVMCLTEESESDNVRAHEIMHTDGDAVEMMVLVLLLLFCELLINICLSHTFLLRWRIIPFSELALPSCICTERVK